MTPVTYMTTMRGVNPLLTKGWCILLGLWDLQWVWNLVHVIFLTPIVLRRLQVFFLDLGLTHPASYVHILHCKTDDTMSEAVLHTRLQVSFMLTQ